MATGVLIADDSRAFRGAARAVVAATAGFRVVGEVESGEEAVRAVSALGPELVLLDVSMPGMGGIEAARRIAEAGSSAVVVLVTAMSSDHVPLAAATCGAVRVMAKQALRPAVLTQLWEAHRGALPAAS